MTQRGRLIKKVRYDNFGLRLHDSLPEIFVPVGFAGGLVDTDTGFVRFGWRDYDPAVGRFTAPDPLGDTGGDHDLYDYCVDDPVSMCDPDGLIPVPLLFLAGKALALGLGLGGAYAAAGVADALGSRYTEHGIKGRRPGTSSTPAWDGVNQIAPKVAATSAVSAIPGLAVTAPGPVIAAAQRVGTAMATNAVWQRVGPAVLGAAAAATGAANPTSIFEKAVRAATHLVEGAVVPGTPRPDSWSSMAGWAAKFASDEIEFQKGQDYFRQLQTK